MGLMGKVFDKHGRMKHYEDDRTGSELCNECGQQVQNLEDHKALTHPKYREDSKPEPKSTLTILAKKALTPEQKALEQYPDTAESGEAYDGEQP